MGKGRIHDLAERGKKVAKTNVIKGKKKNDVLPGKIRGHNHLKEYIHGKKISK